MTSNYAPAAFMAANEKFLKGDGIDDGELDILLKTYVDIEQKILLLGPHFELAHAEINRRKMRLEDYKWARKR